MLGGSIITLGAASLIYLTSEKKANEEERKMLIKLLNDLRTQYIPIYIHAYNLYNHSSQELKGKPGMQEFILKQVEDQGIPITCSISL